MPDSAIRKFGQWITAYDWRPVLDATTAQDKTTTFYNIMQHQVDNHFPMKTKKRCSNDKPWVNDKIRHLIRRRLRAFKSRDAVLWKSLETPSTVQSSTLSSLLQNLSSPRWTLQIRDRGSQPSNR